MKICAFIYMYSDGTSPLAKHVDQNYNFLFQTRVYVCG